MPLRGIRVIEMAGLAPAPLCGMLLADFGATVIRVDKTNASSDFDVLRNGKKSLAVDLKKPEGVDIVKRLSLKCDVLIEPFRKGVMERIGLGPDVLMKDNPKLVYARLTGFGQTGQYSSVAGHDINFLALSGLLSLFGRKEENPLPPCNLAADFGGGGLMCAFGILLALFERNKSGKGQVIDSAMVDGSAYLGSWLFRSQTLPIWGNPRGENALDSGAHYYETYKTKDGKFIAVGAIETNFYRQFISKLNNSNLENQFCEMEKKKKILSQIIASKTRDEWCSIFEMTDACVSPVLELDEVDKHGHNKERGNFLRTPEGVVPKPAPLLSRTPGKTTALQPARENGWDTEEILLDLGFTNEEIKLLTHGGVIKTVTKHSKL